MKSSLSETGSADSSRQPSIQLVLIKLFLYNINYYGIVAINTLN